MSHTRKNTGKKSNNASIKNDIKSGRDLQSREEEYMRLNEQLEAKTASLVREAEEVMREQEQAFSKPSLLDNINTEDFLNDYEEEEEDFMGDSEYQLSQRSVSAPSKSETKVSNETRVQSGRKAKSRPQSRTAKGRPKSSKSNIADNVAVPDDAFMSDFRDFSLQKTITAIEGQLEDGTATRYDEEDVIPSAAAEMGAEAQIRFLKAKLRVMQEELDRLSQECNRKDEENNAMIGRVKETEEERNKLMRTNASQQTQIDKYKRLAEDAKGKADALENQLSGVRKELESLKRSQKQQASSQGVTEVRLNRALEEVEKYKLQLQKSKSSSKESNMADKKRVDQLLADNKKLEKQKNELMTGFKKQLKLIDILKRQKIHIEAARMLQFTEEDFVKALEWGN